MRHAGSILIIVLFFTVVGCASRITPIYEDPSLSIRVELRESRPMTSSSDITFLARTASDITKASSTSRTICSAQLAIREMSM